MSQAVASQDARAISAAQGVGLKSAQKIILELKDKLTDWGTVIEDASVGNDTPQAGNDMFKEAVNALVVLGYSLPRGHDRYPQGKRYNA